MIFFSANMSMDDKKIILENEKSFLNISLLLFKSQKNSLLLCMRKITNYIDNVTSIDDPKVLDTTLSNLKNILDKMHFNEDNLLTLSNMLKKISLDNVDTYKNIDDYNKLLNDIQTQLNANSISFEVFIQEVLEDSDYKIKNQISKFEEIVTTSSGDSPGETITTSEADIKVDSKKEIHTLIADNNCLLISEKENKVFLPYKLCDIKQELENNPNYLNLEDVIQKNYILPLQQFKAPTLSRFKEAYNLMKNKEKASFFEAMSLAIELSLNSTLNPAVIAACKNQDELDIYLDCLYENELDKFKIFEVKYDIAPTIK